MIKHGGDPKSITRKKGLEDEQVCGRTEGNLDGEQEWERLGGMKDYPVEMAGQDWEVQAG